MKKSLLICLFILLSSFIFAQETITAKKEVLTQFKLGAEDIINISITGEDYNGFLGIGVTKDGTLIIPTSIKNPDGGNIVYEYKQKKLVKNLHYKMNVNSFMPISQDGFISVPGELFFFSDNECSKLSYFDYINDDLLPDGMKNNCYFTEKGIIFEKQAIRKNNKKINVLEIKDNKIGNLYTNIEDVNNWLKDQQSLLTVNEENILINKADFLWSVNRGDNNGSFIGKIKNGFNLFESANEEFYITDSNGLKVLSIPIKENKYYSYGVGTWGEIYMVLIPELFETGKESYSTKKGDIAELVVIRNHLKYFGILNDDRIRLRNGPGTDTESLGTYPIKTGFRIIEDSGVKQTIGGVTDTWIKVRLLDGTEGYFFGQYIQNLYDGPGTPLPWPNVADWD